MTPPDDELVEEPMASATIRVIGVGGAGGNAVNNMIDQRLEGVDFVVSNTDSQALSQSKADRRIQLGNGVTEGLGAGLADQVVRFDPPAPGTYTVAADGTLQLTVPSAEIGFEGGVDALGRHAVLGGSTLAGFEPIFGLLARQVNPD